MQKILLATDGSQTAQQAAYFLAHLPHEGKLDLTVVSVLTPPYSAVMTLEAGWIDTCLEQDREQAKQSFAEITQFFEGANTKLENIVVRGHAGESICRLAESRSCDLVVIGAKGHSAVSRILLGSTSDYVATQACCSVLVVRPRETNKTTHPLRIVLGYEETGPAQAAVEEIIEIEWGQQVDFHLVTIVYALGLADAMEIKRISESGRSTAAQLRQSGFNAESHMIENDHLGEGLVKFAEEHDCDMVVLGETPRSNLSRVLLGSTSRYVLRHAPCSVWITRNRPIHGLSQAANAKTAAPT